MGGDPQDHIHNQIARMARTRSDGKWRALAVGLALGDQVVDRGVTLAGPYRQAAVAGVLGGGPVV
jgi:hypothetical protein